MAKDSIGDRFEKRQEQRKLEELAKRARSKEDLDAEKELLEKTPKAEPIKASKTVDRNSPCPCGSGKKYKKCCGQKS